MLITTCCMQLHMTHNSSTRTHFVNSTNTQKHSHHNKLLSYPLAHHT